MDNSRSIIQSLRTEGCVLVPSALSQSQVVRLRQTVKAFHSDLLDGRIRNYSLDNETATDMPALWTKLLAIPAQYQALKRWNIVADDPNFVELIDYEPIFSIVREVMGDFIQLFRSQMIVIPAGVQEQPFLHTDSGQLGRTRSPPDAPPLMVSVQYFLTDLDSEDMGNFAYVPRSQDQAFPTEDENPLGIQTSGFVQGRDVPGRQQVLARAGDAVIFPHSLWHGTSANNGCVDRVSIIFGYSQLFIRPYDYEHQSPQTLAWCGRQRQRRLLGDFGGWYWRPGCLHHPAPDQIEVLSTSAEAPAIIPQ